jgi:hypothetical protein
MSIESIVLFLAEFILGLIVCIVLLYLYFLYLRWADSYRTNMQFDTSLQNSFYANLLPPAYVSDSYKYVNFWINYYTALYDVGQLNVPNMINNIGVVN